MTFDKHNLKKPECIIFDWDGTLVNTNTLYRNILKETLEDIGIAQPNQEMIEEYRYHSTREAMPLLFGEQWEAVFKEYRKKVCDIGVSGVIPFAQSIDLIRYLYEEGVIMSIVSNKEGYILRQEVEYLGWLKYFHKVVGASDAKRDKPSPDPVYLALADIKSSKNSVWFMGDTMVDMQCAQETSCFPILIGTETGAHNVMSKSNMEYIHINEHQELIERYKEAQ